MIHKELEKWANTWYEYSFNNHPNKNNQEMIELRIIINKIKILEIGKNK